MRRRRSAPTGPQFGNRGTRLYAAYVQCRHLPAIAAIVLALCGAWAGSLLIGGSHSPGPQLFYVGIVLAAVRFSWPGAVVGALTAGVLAGPLLPAEAGSMARQSPGEWLLRLAFFAAFGVFIAYLAEGPHPTTRRRLQDAAVSMRLLRALAGGAIEVVYQPIYRVVDGEPAALEALVRWRQSSGHFMSPGRFLPAAERTGAIIRVDRYVLEQAIKAAKEWTRLRALSISVNFSAVTLGQPHLADEVRQVLEKFSFEPSSLEVEITESAMVEDLPTVVEQVHALRDLGVTIAIDDFGSGHASLNYLQHFPADVVKLDRSIVTAAGADERTRLLLEGIIDLCARVDMQVIAEGVESNEQLDVLRRAGVPLVQGFLFGRPAPPGEIRTLLDRTGGKG